jgi:para-nitrobenzyl esterase
MRRQGLLGSRSNRFGTALGVMLSLGACIVGCDSTESSGRPVTSGDPADARKDAAAGERDASRESDASAESDAAQAVPSNTVMTKAGPVAGELVEDSGSGKEVRIFRGVPYAAAPVGELRWKPPQPLEPWTDVRDATEWGNRCPQGDSTLSNPGPISEDCLNLNVITPVIDGDERLPVMVFFHGGGLSIGTGNSDTYCNTALPAQGVVVATVNSRLGPFGYFSHPALAEESEHDSSGNYGTLDLIASLEWVQDNIEAFGGDPHNVTIFGESGGGSKVLSCMASPLARGLFHRAIIESGSRSSAPGAVTPRETAESAGERLATYLEIASDADAPTELRARSWEEILAAAGVAEVDYTANLSIDGWVLPQSVSDAFAAGDQSDVPLIVGANEGEVGEFMQSIPALAASMQSVSSKAYVYNFSHLPVGWRAPGCYAFHGLELPYVFGYLPGITSETILFLGMRSCPTGANPEVGDEDALVAEHTMKIWAQFAKTGDPSVPGLVDWPAYAPDSDQYLEIATELEVKSGVASAGIAPGTE